MIFSRQDWSGLPCPLQWIFQIQGSNLHLLCLLHNHYHHLGSPTYLATEGKYLAGWGGGWPTDLHPVGDGHAAGSSEGAVGAWELRVRWRVISMGSPWSISPTAHQWPAALQVRASFPLRQGALSLWSQLGVNGQPRVILEEVFREKEMVDCTLSGYFGGVGAPQNTDGRMHAWGQTPKENMLLKPGQAQKPHPARISAQRHSGWCLLRREQGPGQPTSWVTSVSSNSNSNSNSNFDSSWNNFSQTSLPTQEALS